MDSAWRPFSRRWVLLSMVSFIAAEILIGMLVGELLLGRVASINTGFLLQGLLNLAGFAFGGFIIGVVSPGRRIAEPAAAGAATMVLITLIAIFVPFRYMGYTNGGIVIAAAAAAAIAGAGAYGGEKLTGNISELNH